MDKVYSEFFPELKFEKFKRIEVVGDIAILKIPRELEPYRFKIGGEVLKCMPSIKTVLRQLSPTSGSYRIKGFEWLAGEHRTVTVHKEHGCIFKVDLSKVYFSPRLLFERLRIAQLTKPGEVIVNMFAGVGCFSIIIAKLKPVSKVYSIDINPDAYKLMVENIKLNKVKCIVKPILGDSKNVIEDTLVNSADRVLMPLPELAYSYLPSAILCLKDSRGWIHYYDFIKAASSENPVDKLSEKVSRILNTFTHDWNIEDSRIVRTIASRTYQIVLDIHIG
ncbi:class I SAM-dependent methyltransferase family protein [Candidatus Bathyarchaeota archaeon]|nr:class I SAM-dependent methyltransferase family protein [Candidatus Bathyarchaeota archaeon]